jgi:uncharacterized membrane-anchored protein
VAIAQQAMNGIVTKVDEPNGTIRIQYGQSGAVGGASSDTSEEFKVKDGLLFNALQIGDRFNSAWNRRMGRRRLQN